MTTSTPDETRRTAEEDTEDSRRVRRRLTFGVAGDLVGMPGAVSPWQRAYEAWRSAGLAWGHGDAPSAKAPSAVQVAPSRNGSTPTAPEEGRSGESKSASGNETGTSAPEETPPRKTDPAKPVRRRLAPEPYDVHVAGPGLAAAKSAEKAAAKGSPRAARRPRARMAVAASLVIVAGGVVVAVNRAGGGPDEPAIPGPVAADALFAADPAAETDGLVQKLAAVTAAGGTLVAVGTEGDGTPGRERTRILTSVDGGRTWSLARVRAADGSAAPPGDAPAVVAAGRRGWVALGRSASGGTVAWTSENARTWTRHDAGAVFKPTDRVRGLARTPGGYAAVGAAGGRRAVVWISPDGRRWQRIEGIGSVTGFDRVVSSGTVLVAHGTYPRKLTVRRGGRRVTRTVPSPGFWRSEDGGRTWARVIIPQGQGSWGATKGLAYGPGGFATVREGKHTSRRKKGRRTVRFGVLFTSRDGREWRAAGRFRGHGIERFGGSPDGLAVVVRGTGGAGRILRTADGRHWKNGGTVPKGVDTSELTVASGGAVAISGTRGDDAYLHGVDLRTVPGAVHPQRSVGAVAARPGRAVAVGSTNGDAAIWTATENRAWRRAEFPDATGRLTDVVHGGRGWLAVGRTSGAKPGHLVMTSPDGITWTKAGLRGGPPLAAAAAGRAGYVAVGTGAAWFTADLKTWRRTALDGAPAAVTEMDGTYVAVGGRDGSPAVWTSEDGGDWKAVKLPDGLAGPLTDVAGRHGVLVAIGADGAPLVSADGGATWAARGLGGGLRATAVAAAPGGFVLAASTPRRDAAVLTSADGVTWRRLRVPGLDGDGDQRLTALTTVGASVLGVGTTADAHVETPLLWTAPAP
ncbi:MAG TPA: hypothetical protein VIL71_15825 [Spirillospora sp.]